MNAHAGLRPLRWGSYSIDDAFWSPRLKLLVEKTLPAQYDQIAKQTPRLDNFRKAAARASGGFVGRYYDDSDVHKWLEACAYALALYPNAKLEADAHYVIDLVVAAQEDDGYLHTYFQLEHPNLKFRNLSMLHEMYCMGHFIEAAVAWSEAMGDDTLMKAADKTVELLIQNFGPDGRPGYCGHEEIEWALIRYADRRKHDGALQLARRMIDLRGTRPSLFEQELKDKEAMTLSPWAQRMLTEDGAYSGTYLQDQVPLRDQKTVVGHAVRAMYLNLAAERFASEDPSLATALGTMWSNLTERRMYITGGIGSAAANEGFTADYDLPNRHGYAETCASVGLALWGREALNRTAESDYAEIIERAAFNGALAGIGLDGTSYFYENPLEARRDKARTPWFECACCPPNIARMIGSVATFAYSVSPKELYVHFPVAGTYRDAESGLEFTVKSQFPFQGKFEITIQKGGAFALCVRYPQWAEDLTIEVVGSDDAADYVGSYVRFDRVWKSGDVVRVDWAMEPTWTQCHPAVTENLGKVALTVGPLVYCLESVDEAVDPARFVADVESEITLNPTSKGLGVVEAKALGLWLESDSPEPLYSPLSGRDYVEGEATFIPYYAWANRGQSAMSVWIRES